MSPERMLLDGLGTPRQRFHALRAIFQPEHAAMLRTLDYGAFLNTGYWRIVRRYVRLERGACNRCGATSGLQAHHRTYEHHGWEHQHLDDLEVLCRSCHRVEHHQVLTAHGAWRSVAEIMPEAMRQLAKRMEIA